MKPEIENAIRAVARRCIDEIIAARKSQPRSEYDSINTRVVSKYTKEIVDLPLPNFPPRQWLIYYVIKLGNEKKH